jgi:HEPN domain-containing protein
MKEAALEWLRSAEEDLVVIESIKNMPTATGAASFHAQQCVEKSLKAVIEQTVGDVPKIHDLQTLFEKTKSLISLPYEEETVDTLSTLYIESRYPGALGLLPHGRPTTEDVAKFLNLAKTVLRMVKDHLEKRYS